jgi:PAS domain S-box-containing protein
MQPLSKSTPADENVYTPVVGIGYSAGGLESVKALLASLPLDTGLAFVIVQHLKPDEESHLADILAKVTLLDVLVIQNQMQVAPNTIYVIPPGVDVALSGNYLNLNARGQSPFNALGIDFFFSSLAQNRGSKAIGVLLSGSGSDGTIGLKAIKSEGGIAIVQDPKTATFDSMPGSAVVSGVADLILAAGDIGKEIARIAKHPYSAEVLKGSSHAAAIDDSKVPAKSFFNSILATLLDQTKIDFSEYKMTTIQRRIERQMMLRKIETVQNYADYISKNPEEVKALYEDIFIHVTDFFRDSDSFEAVKKTVFPALTAGRSKDSPIRLWVPGCATGEEVYSLAISIIEYLEENSLDLTLSIFAGDISEPAVQRARKGAYANYQMRSVSKERIDKFFEPIKGGFKVKKQIRDLCVFSRHDLTSNPPIPLVDFISCRNVLIYFSSDLQKRILPVFHYALKENGFLWLGRAESCDSNPQLFTAVDKAHKIFSKAKSAYAAQPKFSTTSYSSLGSETMKPFKIPSSGSVNDVAGSIDQLLLLRYSPPSVLINNSLEILQFRGRTVPYLEPSPGAASYNLLKMINPDLMAPLRICLQSSKKSGTQVRKEDISFEFDGKKRLVNIDVSPINSTVPANDRQYLVVFEEASPNKNKKSKADLKSRSKTSKGKDGQLPALTQLVTQLQNELDTARDYQQSLTEEYESAQEELTSTNEELRSTNEELQSTNEELHSTNEELSTAKEELQATNEEILSTNEELHKRNDDLESAMAKLEMSEKRFRLMIAGVKDYAIFMLNPEGYITTWNEGAERLNGYKASEIIGSHFTRFYTPEDLARNHPEAELKLAMKNGKYEEEGWRVRKNGTRFWANVLITAIRDGDQNLIGFSKVTRDLTERKSALEELRQSEERFRLMVTEIKDYAIFMLDPEGKVTTWNEGARRLKGYDEREIVGVHFSKFYPDSDQKAGKPEWKLEQARKIGKVEDEGWRVRKDGSEFWANVVITRIDDAQGKILGFAKITRDLTDRKIIEEKRLEEARRIAQLEQVQENERTLDQIFEESPSFMTLLSVPEFRFLKSNSAHRKLIGKDNIIGKMVSETEPDIEAQGFIKLMQQVVQTGKPYIGKEVKVDYAAVANQPARTTYLDFTYQPLRHKNGEVYAIAAQGYEVTEAVLGRKAVENERENFRNLFKETPELVCILKGPDHLFEFVNEAHVRVLGFDATGLTVREAQPESVEVHGILDEVYKTGITASLHEIPVTVTGRLRYFNLTYSARRDDNGKVSGIMILGTEVTDQLQARNLILQNSHQLRSLADSISHIVWMADSNGVIEYYNRRWYDYTGLSENQTKDMGVWREVIHPDDFPRIEKAWRESIKNRTVFETEWRMRNAHGIYRWHLVRTMPSPDSNGEISRWFGTSTDIDDQRRAQESDKILADTSLIFEESLDIDKTLQSLADLMVKYLADWCSIDLVESGNSPRRAAVAHPDPENLLLVQELFRDYPTDWNSPNGAANVLRSGKPELYAEVSEVLLQASAKDERHWELIKSLGIRSVMVVPLTARDKTLGVMTFIASKSGRHYSSHELQVATELGRRVGVVVDNAMLYRQLQRAVSTRDEFLSIASHELKTPLTTLKLQAEITNRALQKGDVAFFNPQRLQKFAHQILSHVGRLNQLVDDMLDVTRIQSGKIEMRPETINLAELTQIICDQLAPMGAAAGSKFELSLAHVIGCWDRQRIEQVLVNIIANAIKYGNGKPVHLRVYQEKQFAKVEVKDQGIGISPENHERIFKRFERAVSPKGISGLGLGLYISNDIVLLHKGSISVESQLGEGSQFTVTLPLDPFGKGESENQSKKHEESK